MKRQLLVTLLVFALCNIARLPTSSFAQEPPDLSIPNGHFYSQGTGNPGGTLGYRITDDGGIPFWHEFQRLGGPEVLGFPISQRFVLQGFVHQATQRAILQWRPESNQIAFLNVFDLLHDAGTDDTLLTARSVPRPADFGAREAGRTFRQNLPERLSLLAANPAIEARFFAISQVIDPLLIYGLPTSPVEDMGNHFAIRLQRAVIQQWKVNTPWAAQGETTVANGGDIAKEMGLIPDGALLPMPKESLDTVDVPVPDDPFARLTEVTKASVVRVVVPNNGFGSGFVFDSGGLILTNHHVVEQAATVLVNVPDGRTLSGTVIGVDPLVDIAVVRVDGTGLRPLPLGNSEAVRPGDDVLAIGYSPAVANPPSARLGNVLSLIQPGQRIDGARVAAIESDVFLHPGDSGGPLLNARGEVVGVNTSIVFVPGDTTIVTSRSVAINLAKQAVEQILGAQPGSRASIDLAALPFLLDRMPAILATSMGQ